MTETELTQKSSPSGGRSSLGRKIISVMLSMVLVLTMVSAAAFAGPTGTAAAEGASQGVGTPKEAVVEAEFHSGPQGGGISLFAAEFGIVHVTEEGSTLTLDWDDIDNAVNYTVERSYILEDDTEKGEYIYELLDDSVDTTSYVDPYVTIPAGYDAYRVWYRITAYDAVGNVLDQARLRIFIEHAIPYITLTADPVRYDSIELAWTPVQYTETYTVLRSTSERVGFAAIGATGTLGFTDTTCVPGTTYYYRIYATDDIGSFMGESNVASAVTAFPVVQGLDAEALSDSSIKVTWTPEDGVTEYIVYRADDSGVYEVAGTATGGEFTDIGLQEDTDYYYKVAVSTPVGEGPQSDAAHAKTLRNAPEAPLGIAATALSDSQISVSWNAVANADSYNVYAGLSDDAVTTFIGTTSSTSLLHNGLNAETTYYYRVEAENTSGVGPLSEVAWATTLKAAPNAPTNIKATALSQSSIKVDWNAVGDADGYYVYRSLTADGPYVLAGTTVTNTFTDTGLNAKTDYYYKVAAFNSTGTGQLSAYAHARTFGWCVPCAPLCVSACALSYDSIQVKWGAVRGAYGYYIYRSETANGPYEYVGTSSTTRFIDTGLSASTGYYYKVAAYNGDGTGALSKYAYAKTHPAACAPKCVSAKALSSNSIQVKWGSVKGATGYYVYRSLSARGTYELVGTTASTSYVDTGLNSSTKYYYKVAAYNNAGTGELSSYAYAKTKAGSSQGCGLAAPKCLSACAKSGSTIQLTWGSVKGASGYYIYRATSPNGEYVQVGTATGTKFVDNGLSMNTVYYYKVAAFNKNGVGAQSSYACAKTPLQRGVPKCAPKVNVCQKYFLNPNISLGTSLPSDVVKVELWVASSKCKTSKPSGWSMCFSKDISQACYTKGFNGYGYYLNDFTQSGSAKQYYYYKYRYVYSDGSYSCYSPIGCAYLSGCK